jgi:hypothetical protein
VAEEAEGVEADSQEVAEEAAAEEAVAEEVAVDNQEEALLQEDLPPQPQHQLQHQPHLEMEKGCMEARQASSMALGTRATSSSRNLAYIT